MEGSDGCSPGKTLNGLVKDGGKACSFAMNTTPITTINKMAKTFVRENIDITLEASLRL